MVASNRASRPLKGEDLETTHWEDAHHWMSIYADLIRFHIGLLARIQRELPKLQPVARDAAAVDVVIIGDLIAGYQARLDLWHALQPPAGPFVIG